MDFILTLHSHLPWVLNHGRWPHGSDWLCEAALDTYLPLLETLEALEQAGVAAPVTLGITPVLGNQLASPAFAEEMEAFFAQRLKACDEAPASFTVTHDEALLPLVAYWRDRLARLQARFRRSDGDLVRAFRALEGRGRLEIISSAATHGFLPLLGRDESIRLQLRVGRAEHKRLFGRAPEGIWLPECAYRPAGRWAPPGATPVAHRPATHEFLREAGYRFFFVDAHLAHSGAFLGQYHEVPLGAERFDAERHDPDTKAVTGEIERSPYRAYRMPGAGRSILAFVRDPRSSMQVWSRRQGYPGDGAYLEFHKIRWPGGLKLWRVTSGDADLGDKVAYDPAAALARAGDHAGHFAGVLAAIAATEKDGRVVTAPFDTELFGHWWFEGVDFLGALYRRLADGGVRPVTARAHIAAHRGARPIVQLAEGSWGANGDFSMWMNPGTEWTWKRMWPLEDAFWSVARGALAGEPRRTILAQAARALLLAQASDWQFVISTGAAADYAEKRFTQHCHDAEQMVAALRPGADDAALAAGERLAADCRSRDDLFPDVLSQVAEVLG